VPVQPGEVRLRGKQFAVTRRPPDPVTRSNPAHRTGSSTERLPLSPTAATNRKKGHRSRTGLRTRRAESYRTVTTMYDESSSPEVPRGTAPGVPAAAISRRVNAEGRAAPPARGTTRPSYVLRGAAARAQMSSVTLPPAAVIFSLAEPETASTVTCSATEISPWPRTLTRLFLRTAPLATRPSTVTSPPSG
jgi:hypothetical protein